MKLKRIPEDFQVEELPSVEPVERGRYAFYRLTKRGIGTIEAIEAIRRRWNVASSRLHYGGLKDRHALTIQYVSILEGPMQVMEQENLTLEPVGRLLHPYGPAHFQGNRFSLVLRDLSSQAAERAEEAARQVPTDGLPNYFDDQRFGSVGFSGGFIAEAWLKGDHEQAFRLAMAEPNPSDRPGTKQEKAILRETWGDWAEAKNRLPRSHARSLVTYLVDHPTDFRGAFARLKRELRSLYFSAYQSYLWNLMLGKLIENATRPDQRVPIDFKVATLPLHRGLDPDQARELTGWKIPLPASRTPLDRGAGQRPGAERAGAAGAFLGRPEGAAPEGCLFFQGKPECPVFPGEPGASGRARRPVPGAAEGAPVVRPAERGVCDAGGEAADGRGVRGSFKNLFLESAPRLRRF